MSQHIVYTMYKFVALKRWRELREPLLAVMTAQDIRGTVLLASEGINATVSGRIDNIAEFMRWLRQQEGLADLEYKQSITDTPPFKRAKVKLRKEIVSMGVPGIDPRHVVGTYVEPEDWNQLISNPDVLLIDTRNRYEVDVGTFANAVNPQIDSFREFPDYVKQHLDPAKHRRVAMFCTGGIRCEKSTALLKEQGFAEVYHLKGGVLKYFEEVPQENSLWQGECFVFDDRVAVNHALEAGRYDQCHACRMPITDAHKASPHYEKGISCPHCYAKTAPVDRQRFAQREKQLTLAKQRGESHLGADAANTLEQKRVAKRARRRAAQSVTSD